MNIGLRGRLGELQQLGHVDQPRPGNRRAGWSNQVIVAQVAPRQRFANGGRGQTALQFQAIAVEDVPVRQKALRSMFRFRAGCDPG